MAKDAVVNEVTTLNFISLEDVLGKNDAELLALKMDIIESEKLGQIPVTELSNQEYKVIKKDCMSFVKSRGGRMTPEIDDDRLMVELVIAAVDKDTRSNFTFKNGELLGKLGVISASQAVEKLLAPGEIVNAAVVVQDISGFGEKAEEERKAEVKNS